jgi:hypothetical protein
MGTTNTMPVELKATSLSELLDRTFTLYRNNFWLVCGIMIMPEVVLMLLSMLYVIAFPIKFVPITPNRSNPFAALAGMQSNIAASLVLLLLRGLAYAFALGCMTLAVSEIYLGRRITIRQIYAATFPRTGGLFGLTLMLGLIGFGFLLVVELVVIALGAVLAGVLASSSPILIGAILVLGVIGGFIVGFWLMMRFAVSVPAFVLERRGVFNSLQRSGVLTKGHRFRIFVACVVILLVYYVVQALFTVPFSIIMTVHMLSGTLPLWVVITTQIAGTISAILTSPLLIITLALFYYDVRIRKEAFDLETMMNALGPTDATSAGTGAPPPLQPAQ